MPGGAPLSLCTAVPFLVACAGGEGGAHPGEWTATADTIGDTIVVRTEQGSVWGPSVELVEELRIGALEGADEYTFGQIAGLAIDADGSIYVVDRQIPALRKYGPDGSYLSTFGGKGGGPGEYENPDGGITVLPDRRVVLRDPGNGRLNVYSPEGEALDHWPTTAGHYTSNPLFSDTAGHLYVYMWSFEDGTNFLVHRDADGALVDTLPRPEFDRESAVLEAVFEEGDNRSFSRSTVPFSPTDHWSFSPFGYYVSGWSDRYSFDLLRRDAPTLRIERGRDPVPVKPDEKANERERMTANMRFTDPKWDWNGPPIPDTKPAYQALMADLDGRIWVLVHVEAEEIPVAEREEEEFGGRKYPAARWREPTVVDVFDPAGRYLGEVTMPPRTRFITARSERVWAIARDELDVEYVVRYRIVPSRADVVSSG